MAYILVAEDDPKQAELVRRYLRREDHSVRVVGDGRSAVDQVRKDRPDLLVLDVMMPELDGLDVCRVLRREYDLPVLMATARAGADDKLPGFDLGADDYLTKPYDPRELMARIRSLLLVTDTTGVQPTSYLVPLTYRGAPLDSAISASPNRSGSGTEGPELMAVPPRMYA